MPNLPLKLQGIAPDLPAWEQGEAWGDCTNMRFPRGQVSERVRGNDDTGVSTGVFPGYLQNYYDIASNWWLISAFDNVLAWNGADPPSDVTPAIYATLGDPGQWTGTRGPFLNHLILNTVERVEPYVWSAAAPTTAMDTYVAETGFVAPNCTCLRGLFSSFIFCLDTADDASGNWDSSPTTIVWSDSSTGSLPTFIPATGNRAGSTTLATSTPLIDAIQLRESAILFSSTDIFRVDFIGGQEVFDFTRIFSGDGILARNCCAEYEGTVYFLSTSGALMATDGTNVTTIGDDRVNRTILNSLADDARGSWVTANPVSREIVFAPLSINETAPTTGYLLDVDSGRIGKRTFPDGGAPFGLAGVNSATANDSWNGGAAISWNDPSGDYPWNRRFSTPGSAILFFTTLAEKLYRADVNETFMASQLSREGITPDPQSDRVFLLSRVWIDANIGESIVITVGSRYDDSSAWQGTSVAITPGVRSIPFAKKGRQFRLRVDGNGITGWDISRIQMEFSDSTSRF